MTRLCTLADGGQITEADVRGEIAHLQADVRHGEVDASPGTASDAGQLTTRVVGGIIWPVSISTSLHLAPSHLSLCN